MTKVLVYSATEGRRGVRTIIEKLYRGMIISGYQTRMYKLRGSLFNRLYEDLLLSRYLGDFDAVIYLGSFPLPSGILLPNHTKKFLFIHGIVEDEYMSKLSEGRVLQLYNLTLLLYWKIFMPLSKLSNFKFICHTFTVCDLNNIRKNFIILPQFLLPEDFEEFNQIRSTFRINHQYQRIITYSNVRSKRLLPLESLVSLGKEILSKNTIRNVRYTIIDTQATRKFSMEFQGGVLEIIPPLERRSFLRLLGSSSIFIERFLDEELGYSSLEAGLLKIPVAKMTLPKYKSRQDYTEKEVIIGNSFKNLVEKILLFLEDIEFYSKYYGKNFYEFLVRNRQWNHISRRLIEEIEQ